MFFGLAGSHGVSYQSGPYRPGLHTIFFVVSYKLYTTGQPVMQGGSGSEYSGGHRALRQRQFDTQPSSDCESEHPDLCEVTDSDSNGVFIMEMIRRRRPGGE